MLPMLNPKALLFLPSAAAPETEPTEPGPLALVDFFPLYLNPLEQYPCTRLYSVHKPCKQCLNEICFYSLRRVYVINKEICVRTVCAHEELLRGKDSSIKIRDIPTHRWVPPRRMLMVKHSRATLSRLLHLVL
uniref:Microfibril associated protein 2 n=1 Tax=Phasianus colchicus TaxID=9054 RepID=A0A669QPK0_PHACC